MEGFHLLDNETIVNSFVNRDFLILYHQQGAKLNDSDQNVAFIFGENNNHHQISNAYIEFDLTVPNLFANFDETSGIRLINNAFAYFKEAFLSTTGGSDMEHNK